MPRRLLLCVKYLERGRAPVRGPEKKLQARVNVLEQTRYASTPGVKVVVTPYCPALVEPMSLQRKDEIRDYKPENDANQETMYVLEVHV